MNQPMWFKIANISDDIGEDAARCMAKRFTDPRPVSDERGNVVGQIVALDYRDGELWALASPTRDVEVLTMRWETL